MHRQSHSGTVTVRVDRLLKPAFDSAGTIRIRGTTAAQFIAKPNEQTSRLERFRDQLSSLLGHVDEVDVFSGEYIRGGRE